MFDVGSRPIDGWKAVLLSPLDDFSVVAIEHCVWKYEEPIYPVSHHLRESALEVLRG